MAIEIPKYKILKKDGRFELRDYDDFIVAKVKVEAEKYDYATNVGFGILADFIFGNNIKRMKISMTAPVSQEDISSEKIAMTAPVSVEAPRRHIYTVSFTMPHHYTLENLPIPNNKTISFEKVPSHKAAAVKFS